MRTVLLVGGPISPFLYSAILMFVKNGKCLLKYLPLHTTKHWEDLDLPNI